MFHVKPFGTMGVLCASSVPTHSSEVVSYKRDNLAFTKVNRAMAIHSNPGIHCNKERQMSARQPPRADLSDP